MANKTPEQFALDELLGLMGEDMFQRMWGFFKALCPPLLHPFTEREQHKAYITAESFEKNLPKYFGHKCDFLAVRLFHYLSEGVRIARVYFRIFLEKFFCLLWMSEPREKQRFVFSLLDTDGDGIIGGPDLIKC